MAESGSHRELLEQDGIYAELWNGMVPDRTVPRIEANQLVGLTAQELSLAQDMEYERNTQVESDGPEAENSTPQPKQR